MPDRRRFNMTQEQSISAAFPFESKYVEVLGLKLHYVEEGEGGG